MFRLAGVSGRILEGTEDIQKCLSMEINYDGVHQNFAKIREESYQYLQKALEDKESTDL